MAPDFFFNFKGLWPATPFFGYYISFENEENHCETPQTPLFDLIFFALQSFLYSVELLGIILY